MPDPNARWIVKFVEKPEGDEVDIDHDGGTFQSFCQKENIPYGIVLKKVLSLLFPEHDELRRRYPVVGSRYEFDGFHKCRADNARIFFQADEQSRVFVFAVRNRGDLKISKFRKTQKRRRR